MHWLYPGAYFRMDVVLYLNVHACKVFEKRLETNGIPYHTLSLAFFLFNLENTKSAFVEILAVLANVCHPPVCSLLIQCWERFRRKNGINHSNYYILQCPLSQISSFLSTGVECTYLPINLCPVVDCESQWILFPWLRNLLGCSPLSGVVHASLAFHKDNYRIAFLPVFTKLAGICFLQLFVKPWLNGCGPRQKLWDQHTDIDIHTDILWLSYIYLDSLRSKENGMCSGNHIVGSAWDKKSPRVSCASLQIQSRGWEEYSTFSFPAYLSFPAYVPPTLQGMLGGFLLLL